MSSQALSRVPNDLRKETTNSAYILPWNQGEADRLELQHRVLKEVWDDRILLCPFEEQGTYNVLDSGVGRGSWICEISSQLSPSSDLQGIDIKNDNFPNELPSNVSLSVNSVLVLPDDWVSRFDIVHQGLLMSALRRAEWPIALSQIYRVVRPGGWVQLREYGVLQGGPYTERHMRMQREVYKQRGLDRDIAQDLPALLKAAGFTNINEEKRMVPVGVWAGRLGEDARDMSIAYAKAIKTNVLKAGGGFAQTEEDYDISVNSLAKEWDETKGAGYEFHIICAQRPLK